MGCVSVFEKISLCFDVYGCPNRCKHCWIGHKQNKIMSKDGIRKIVNEFADFSSKIEVYSWLREPDFSDEYKNLWEFDKEVSINVKPKRFELLSFYRLVRDEKYIEWLKDFDIKTYQLTIFGNEQTTDYYTGRKGAYKEILKATNILLDNGFIPKWQMFVYKDNIDDIDHVLSLINSMELIDRSKENGGTFQFFIHTGSCDGENSKNYYKWVESSDLHKIPLEYFKNYGKEERLLYEELLQSKDIKKLNESSPVFYIDNEFNIYPNFSEMNEHWKLGNLNLESVEDLLNIYIDNRSPAQSLRNTIPLCDLVVKYGDPNSKKLFSKEDYIDFLINTHFRKLI